MKIYKNKKNAKTSTNMHHLLCQQYCENVFCSLKLNKIIISFCQSLFSFLIFGTASYTVVRNRHFGIPFVYTDLYICTY